MTRYPAGVTGVKVPVSTTEAANATLMATFCKDQLPRSCDHALLTNATRSPRPCSLAESFLSSGDSLTLELRTGESTALRCVQCAVETQRALQATGNSEPLIFTRVAATKIIPSRSRG
jgi:hypothetical protein